MPCGSKYGTIQPMSTPHIIGIAGTAGAGKDAAAEILCDLFGMQNMSSGDTLRAITRYIYRLDPDAKPLREPLYHVANYLRTEVNPATLVHLCILQAQVLQLDRVLITGLRSMGEAQAIRDAGGTILAIDADPSIRYDRIFTRGRDAEAKKTLEEFLAHDEVENRGISDKGPGRGITAIIQSADIVITNNGSLEELRTELQRTIAPLLQ
jgi:dephospho-CoA kinase